MGFGYSKKGNQVILEFDELEELLSEFDVLDGKRIKKIEIKDRSLIIN